MEFSWAIVALLASVLWGLVYVLDKKVFEFLNVVELLAIHSTFSAVVLWLIVVFKGETALLFDKLMNKDYFGWIAATVLCGFFATLLIAKSIQLSNATLAAVLEISYPLFTIIFSYLILKEVTLTKDVMIGGILIFIGVVYIALRANVQT